MKYIKEILTVEEGLDFFKRRALFVIYNQHDGNGGRIGFIRGESGWEFSQRNFVNDEGTMQLMFVHMFERFPEQYTEEMKLETFAMVEEIKKHPKVRLFFLF